MTVHLRRLFLVATPLALAVVLWWHPAGGENVYEGVRDDVGAWLFVHTALLLFMPLLGLAAFLLLSGLRSLAATVSRIAVVFGVLGWVVAMLAAAVAFRRAGAGWPVTVLVGFAALFAIHPPPVGPVGLACFAAAAVLIERAKAREAKAPAVPPAVRDAPGSQRTRASTSGG